MKPILTLLSICIPLLGLAQVQITSADILALTGSTVTYETDTMEGGVMVDVGMPGADQQYDLSQQLSASLSFKQSYVDPMGTPYAASFTDANLALTTTIATDSASLEVFSYALVTPDAWTQLGGATSFSIGGIDTIFITNERSLFQPLPLAFGSVWSTMSSDTLEIIAGSSLITTDSSASEADGWGTITLPSGTYNCLRVNTTNVSTSTTQINGMVFGQTETSSQDYQWYAPEVGLLASVNISEVTGLTGPSTTEASVTRLAGNSTATHDISSKQSTLLVQPNPIVQSTSVSFEMERSGRGEIRLLGRDGQKVSDLYQGGFTAGANVISVQLDNGLPTGIYIIEVLSGEGRMVKQVVIR